ncbi:adenosine receptor A2b-like [Heptranchias perlo]|uniref:adenosine receptor A2b-like n=1 Tax=Heptranchias perlo TaxID=212740 RepID=UPI00355A7BBA
MTINGFVYLNEGGFSSGFAGIAGIWRDMESKLRAFLTATRGSSSFLKTKTASKSVRATEGQLLTESMGLCSLFIVLEAALAIGVIGMNLLVCATVYLHRELRTLTNYLIVCLALADLSVGALAVPCSILLSLDLTVCFYGCLFMACCPLITTQFSVFVLLAIAVNTHLKIRQPSRYSLLVTKKRITMAISLCWISALIIGFAPVMGWNGFHSFLDSTPNITLPVERASLGQRISLVGFFPQPFDIPQPANRSWRVTCSFRGVISFNYMVYFMFFCCTLLPLAAMCGIYTDSFRIVRRYFNNQQFRSAKRSEMQTAKALFLMVGLFFFCWMPLNVVNSLSFFCPSCSLPSWLGDFVVILSHLNSLANPMVYALRKRDFGAALKAVFVRYVLCALKYQSCVSSSKVAPMLPHLLSCSSIFCFYSQVDIWRPDVDKPF